VSAKQFIAALAEAIRTGPNTDKCNVPQCHGYAAEVLNGDNLMEVLEMAVKSATGKARAFICGRAGCPDAIEPVCPQ
jgi:hypothetical protein